MTGLGWLAIVRLGLVQSAIGAIVVLTTTTLNRIMVVEYGLAASLPAGLVAFHYAVQLSRARWGHGSDGGARRTPWIVGGMAVLAAGGFLAALATTWSGRPEGIALAVAAFALIGVGVGAAGTSLLALLASSVAPARRPAAAAITWIMMIVGFIVTTGVAGQLLDPFSPDRLLAVVGGVAVIAFVVALIGVAGVEREPAISAPKGDFAAALREIWADPRSRRFTVFVAVSMVAYSAQELILEPFAGLLFRYTPGQSTSLAALQHCGALLGMIVVGVGGSVFGRGAGWMRGWTIAGCVGSAVALGGLALAAVAAPDWPLRPTVMILGLANGVFAVAAVGSMMGLAGAGGAGREGVRMGVWGAAQAIAFAFGGFIGAVGVDLGRRLSGSTPHAFLTVFAAEAAVFVIAAVLAARVDAPATGPSTLQFAEDNAMTETGAETVDVVVIGGGPSGATAAADLARAGRSVILLDRAGRIKPCGGAIPPRLMRDFAVPDSVLVGHAKAARMIAPSDRAVDMPIEGGFVGMVDRGAFDEWLRVRAASAGARRETGTYEAIERDPDGTAVVVFRPKGAARHDALQRLRTRAVIGADGARSGVARHALKGAERTPCVFAYHEVIATPADAAFDRERCDIYYQGKLSPDFYAWIFPHGNETSVGVGSANKGFSLKDAVARLRLDTGLTDCATIRVEGAPIPLKPLKKWDNGRDVIVAGDAAGVVAPASGEGIYYAMTAGREAATAVGEFLTSGNPKALAGARKRFMKAHGRVFWILGMMQHFWYSSDKRRERFVKICDDADVQRLTWQAYMNKELVRADPMAHVRIFLKDLGHLFGIGSTAA